MRNGKIAVVATAVSGAFMAGMDTTVVNLGVPVLKGAFGAELNSIQWVITAYSLTMAAFTPLSAYLAKRFGLRRPFTAALGLFTLGSAFCSLSSTLGMLIAARVLQAIGGSALLATGMMIALAAFPQDQRGRALAWYGIPSMIAPALGPILGGYLIGALGWRSLFLINLPIGLAGMAMALASLRDTSAGGDPGSAFDLFGFLLIALASAGITFAVSQSASLGWLRLQTGALLIVSVALLGCFVLYELARTRKRKEPLLDLRLFRHPSFWSGGTALIVVVFAMFGPLFLVPVYLQSARDMGVFQAGLIMTWNAAASMIAAFAGGRLVDRFGGRMVVIPGLIAFAIDTFLFSFLGPHTSFILVAALLFLRGIGSGLTTQPLVAASLHDLQEAAEVVHASTLTGVLRNLVGGAGVAVIASFVQSRAARLSAGGGAGGHRLLPTEALTAAIDASFLLCLALLILALIVVVAVLPKREARPPRLTAKSAARGLL